MAPMADKYSLLRSMSAISEDLDRLLKELKLAVMSRDVLVIKDSIDKANRLFNSAMEIFAEAKPLMRDSAGAKEEVDRYISVYYRMFKLITLPYSIELLEEIIDICRARSSEECEKSAEQLAERLRSFESTLKS